MESKVVDSFRGEYRFLSNFYPYPINIGKFEYPTVEHYFQAMKCVRASDREKIRKAASPGEAKKLGRKVELRKDWDDVKIKIMKVALREKFKDPTLARQLLNTGDSILVEGNVWGDVFWGKCKGRGQNILGKLLMKIRQELSAFPRK